MNVTVTKVAAVQFQHSVTDKKPGTRYAVSVDGTLIGYVSSHSEESWATSGRIRTRMLGYNRSWLGHLDTNNRKTMPTSRGADAYGYTRKTAVDRLVTAWQNANK